MKICLRRANELSLTCVYDLLFSLGISPGSTLLAINGASVKGMSDAEVRDVSRQFPGSKLVLTMRMPGVQDSRQAVERVVFFNKQQTSHDGIANWQKSLFGPFKKDEMQVPQNEQPQQHQALTLTPRTRKNILTESPPCSPEKQDHTAQVGLLLTRSRPFKVVSADGLADEAHRRQGHRGYSNAAVLPEDELLEVDGRSVCNLDFCDVQKLLGGPPGESVCSVL